MSEEMLSVFLFLFFLSFLCLFAFSGETKIDTLERSWHIEQVAYGQTKNHNSGGCRTYIAFGADNGSVETWPIDETTGKSTLHCISTNDDDG